MFGIDITVLAFAGLIGMTALAAVYAFRYDAFNDEATREKRMNSLEKGTPSRTNLAKAKKEEQNRRRQSVQDSLKELDEATQKRTQKTLSLKNQLRQAGFKASVKQFYMYSLCVGIVCGVFAIFLDIPPAISLGIMFVGGLGLPRWYLKRKRNKRFMAFLEEFPNAVDVIVRGIKAGLPLNDCMRIVSTEAREPVASEFKRIMEVQQLGVPMSQAVLKLYDNVPLAEANFFSIVIALQQSTGGNLSESLGNLSKVLRERKKMKAKIVALSSEAKTSAAIIGALPLFVAGAVYALTPEYISILFTDSTGNLVLLGAAAMMSFGVFVMKQMINFEI